MYGSFLHLRSDQNMALSSVTLNQHVYFNMRLFTAEDEECVNSCEPHCLQVESCVLKQERSKPVNSNLG